MYKDNTTFKSNNNEDFDIKASDCLEDARKFHEEYLIKGKKSDLESAVDYYIDAIKYNPNIAEAYYRLATLLWENGEINLSSAIEQCKSAVNISPNNPNARIYAGYFLELAKRYDEAEEEFKTAIKLSPVKSARSRLSLASLYKDKMNNSNINPSDLSKYMYYMVTGGASIAFDYPSLKMLCKNIHKNISVMFYDFIGTVLEKTKNYSMAVKTYDMAANNIGRDDIYYHKIGDINVKKDEIADAKASYMKALASNPYDKKLLLKVAALTKEYYQDDVDTEIDCYTKLLELEEDNASIYYELGHLYMKKDDVINSINAFKLALEKDWENPFYHNAMGYALVRAEQFEEACEHYKFAIDKNPNPEWTSIVCQSLASVYYNVFEDVDSALDTLKAAIMFDSMNDEVYVELGDIYHESEDLDSAIKAYCEAIKLNPINPVAYNKCAMVLWQKDYIEEAIIAYNKAISMDPKYYSAYNNLGVIYLDGIRNLKEAKKLFEKAIFLNKDYTMAYYNLGRTYEELGKKVEAANYYQAAIELNQKLPEIDEEEVKAKLYSLFEV